MNADINERLRRRLLLEYLADSPQHRANAVMAAEALSARGLPTGVAAVSAAARWLEARGLLAVDAFGDFLVFDLTAAGLDCAEGRETLDGLAPWRPRR